MIIFLLKLQQNQGLLSLRICWIPCSITDFQPYFSSLVKAAPLAGEWPLFWKLHPAVAVRPPNNDGRDAVFNTFRMMWWATLISEISVGLLHVGGQQWHKKKIHSLPACLPSALLYDDEIPTLFSTLFVSGYHFCLFHCLQHLSGHLFYYLSSFSSFLPFLLPVFLSGNPSTCSLPPCQPPSWGPAFQKWNSKTLQAIWWLVLGVL